MPTGLHNKSNRAGQKRAENSNHNLHFALHRLKHKLLGLYSFNPRFRRTSLGRCSEHYDTDTNTATSINTSSLAPIALTNTTEFTISFNNTSKTSKYITNQRRIRIAGETASAADTT